MSLKEKYGNTALIAGASEGIGAAFAERLAAEGLNLVLVARRLEPLESLAAKIRTASSVHIQCIVCDLSRGNALQQVVDQLEDRAIDLLVYNAALSSIGPFEANTTDYNHRIAMTNVLSPTRFVQYFGTAMLGKGSGGIVLMASLAGLQGSGFLSMYAATKAFNQVLAESLWYEWREKGVDVIACIAGATATPGFLQTNPEDPGLIAPKVQEPAAVVSECLKNLGKRPSIITGRSNRVASFIMQKLLPRKLAIKIMGDTTRKMYRL